MSFSQSINLSLKSNSFFVSIACKLSLWSANSPNELDINVVSKSTLVSKSSIWAELACPADDADSEASEEELEIELEEDLKDNVVDASNRFKKKDDNDGNK